VGLYHHRLTRIYILTCIYLWVGWIVACTPPQVTQGLIAVTIHADGKAFQVQVQAGSTVQDALTTAELTPGDTDRSEPPIYTVLSDGSEIRLIRVREEYYIEQEVVPFEHQELRNEALPIGERILSQPGVNGIQEITYRRVIEDEVEVSNTVVKTEIIQEAIPEIIMVGSQTPFASLAITGRIVYLSAGNAWIMDGTTGNRQAVVTTSDLDGQVFSLSPDGDWLLFTRVMGEENTINELWAARMDSDPTLMVNLGVNNIVHFADWGSSLSIVGYSTVEPRTAPPGWQANNDLSIIGVSPSGTVSPARLEIDSNSGGVYGWWGMDFVWALDGERLAYARPDSIGIYDTRQDILQAIVNLLPFQTGSDWAWVPGVSWAPDGNILYSVAHIAVPGLEVPEESPRFDLLAIPLTGGSPVNLVADVGMFAYPEPSPLASSIISGTQQEGSIPVIENAYQVAYLQAIFPSQSDTSRYRLFVMDRDGSNRVGLFPSEGAAGMDPQRVVWSPTQMGEETSYWIGLLFQGNIWLVDSSNGQAQQITGDGLTVRIDWR
jgi:hypothetical protein